VSDLHALWLNRRVPIDTRAFSGFGAFKFTMRVTGPKKSPNLHP